MFEKAKPLSSPVTAPGAGARVATGPLRRAGDALRAVEWSELTARLNAARDLRLLLRAESQPPIEAVAASFGDAAASYFALLDDDEPAVNRNALGQSKASGANVGANPANRRPGHTEESASIRPAAMREIGHD